MDRHTTGFKLRRELERVTRARKAAAADPALSARRLALRRFQADRIARTHSDLLAASDSAPAARFFLTDLYGSHDLTERDANLARIVPTMERMLPEAALHTIAEAVALDALSEKLDRIMAEALGVDFSEADYVAVFRSLTSTHERRLQLAHMDSVGRALCQLVRVPLIGSTLRVMRGPARLGQLMQLQEFLERGYHAFKGMRHPERFVGTVVERERKLMERIYAGVEDPFAIH
ncbi:MAG TPA: hypothetical protein VM406_09455 [Noviherbaspirillum sp.]|nr:hypothetical protein [Noviherbaspirillum sp.]